MQCEQFEQRLHGLLDRRAVPSHDALLRAHAQVCTRCASLLRHEEELAESLAYDAATLDADFTDSVLKRLEPEPASRFARRAWRSARARRGAAAAAAVLLCLAVAWHQPRAPRHDGGKTPVVATRDSSQGLSPPSPADLEAWDEPDGGAAARELVTLATRRFEDADEVAATVAGDLSPWARSIRSALAALTAVWPGAHDTAPSAASHEPAQSD